MNVSGPTESMGATVLWIMQAYKYQWFGFTSGPTEIESRLEAHYRAGMVPIREMTHWALDKRRWNR